MWQLDRFVIRAIDPIPDEGMDVLTRSTDLLVDLVDRLLRLNALLMRLVDQFGQLVQFIATQEANVHQINQCAAVLKLLSLLVHVRVKLLEHIISELLLDCVDKSLEGEREGWSDRFEYFGVSHAGQAGLLDESEEVIPTFNVVDDVLWVICSREEHFLQLLLIVDVDVADIGSWLRLSHNVRGLVDLYHCLSLLARALCLFSVNF